MGCEVLVLDLEAVHRDGSYEPRLAVLADGQRRVVLLEAAAEGRDDHVLDREADGRVDGVVLPGAGGNLLRGDWH